MDKTSPPHAMPPSRAPRTDSLVKRRGEIRDHALYRLACDHEQQLIEAQAVLREAVAAYDSWVTYDGDGSPEPDYITRARAVLLAV